MPGRNLSDYKAPCTPAGFVFARYLVNCLSLPKLLRVTTLVNTSNKGPSGKKKGRSKKAHVLAASVEQATQNFLEKGDQIAKESQDLKEELVAAVEDVRKQEKTNSNNNEEAQKRKKILNRITQNDTDIHLLSTLQAGEKSLSENSLRIELQKDVKIPTLKWFKTLLMKKQMLQSISKSCYTKKPLVTLLEGKGVVPSSLCPSAASDGRHLAKGETMRIASSEFADDPCSSVKRGTMVRAARALLSAVTRLLILADMADVMRLLSHLKIVEEALEAVKNATNEQDLANRFKEFGKEMVKLNYVAARRQQELKDPHCRDEMAAARGALKKNATMLYTASQAFLRHPDVAATRANRDYVFKQVQEAIAGISNAAQATSPTDENKGHTGIGELAAALNEFDNKIILDPMTFSEARFRPSLEERLESIISGAALMADSSCTRDDRRERIVAECNAVRQALQDLLSEYMNNGQIFASSNSCNYLKRTTQRERNTDRCIITDEDMEPNPMDAREYCLSLHGSSMEIPKNDEKRKQIVLDYFSSQMINRTERSYKLRMSNIAEHEALGNKGERDKLHLNVKKSIKQFRENEWKKIHGEGTEILDAGTKVGTKTSSEDSERCSSSRFTARNTRNQLESSPSFLFSKMSKYVTKDKKYHLNFADRCKTAAEEYLHISRFVFAVYNSSSTLPFVNLSSNSQLPLVNIPADIAGTGVEKISLHLTIPEIFLDYRTRFLNIDRSSKGVLAYETLRLAVLKVFKTR
ncbi:hypothetical protein IHE44_0012810 [Lamprotornis superbus]|uniref:Catenin alpha-2 n=1 Tax=Lamprotornis superbus TaxID=245042 RepID=A0A835NPS4_9PASS|nr:hypothetical protein IHE44_0012810 [Lamprotornis superbus]